MATMLQRAPTMPRAASAAPVGAPTPSQAPAGATVQQALASAPLSSPVPAGPAPRPNGLESGLNLRGLLTKLGLEKYTARFEAEEVVIENMPHLTREDYKELGLPLGPRTTLWAYFHAQ